MFCLHRQPPHPDARQTDIRIYSWCQQSLLRTGQASNLLKLPTQCPYVYRCVLCDIHCTPQFTVALHMLTFTFLWPTTIIIFDYVLLQYGLCPSVENADTVVHIYILKVQFELPSVLFAAILHSTTAIDSLGNCPLQLLLYQRTTCISQRYDRCSPSVLCTRLQTTFSLPTSCYTKVYAEYRERKNCCTHSTCSDS